MNLTGLEIDRVTADIAVWHRYDQQVKAELFSSALAVSSEIFLVDPIAIDPAALKALASGREIQGIIVTNANHHRAASQLATHLAAPIFAHASAAIPDASEISESDSISADLRVCEIEGAVPGEIALISETNGGTLVVGDALINFGTHEFSFLPAKYCSNQKLMRKSLRKLLDFPFERILFAHGAPIVTKARARLEALLQDAR